MTDKILTQEQAQELCDAHDVWNIIKQGEERELMKENNPDLLEAYEVLYSIAITGEYNHEG